MIPLFHQRLPFYGKNLNPLPFFKKFENSNLLLYKGGGSNYDNALCDSKSPI